MSAPLKHVGLRRECPACQAVAVVPPPGGPGGQAQGQGQGEAPPAGGPPAAEPEQGGAPQQESGPAAEGGGMGPPRRRTVWTWVVSALLLLAVLTLLLWRGCAPRQGGAGRSPDGTEDGRGAAEQPADDGEGEGEGEGDQDGPSAAEEPEEDGDGGRLRGGIGRPREEPPPSDPPSAEEASVWEEAVLAVRRQLKHPERAEFARLGEPGTSLQRRGDRYVARGVVRAPDASGRMVRLRFRCEVAQLPDVDIWRGEKVSFERE